MGVRLLAETSIGQVLYLFLPRRGVIEWQLLFRAKIMRVLM